MTRTRYPRYPHGETIPPDAPLTERERMILEVLRSHDAVSAASLLGLQPGTVKQVARVAWGKIRNPTPISRRQETQQLETINLDALPTAHPHEITIRTPTPNRYPYRAVVDLARRLPNRPWIGGLTRELISLLRAADGSESSITSVVERLDIGKRSMMRLLHELCLVLGSGWNDELSALERPGAQPMKPILLLDVDGVFLAIVDGTQVWRDETIPFLRWAVQYFRAKWHSPWAYNGRIDAQLSRLGASDLSPLIGRQDYVEFKLDRVDMASNFWVLEDDLNDLSDAWLAAHDRSDRYIYVNPFGMDGLRDAWRRLAEATVGVETLPPST